MTTITTKMLMAVNAAYAAAANDDYDGSVGNNVDVMVFVIIMHNLAFK